MTVRKRHVLFLAGFDPKGASYYHGLYRREAVKQGQVTAVEYLVGPRRTGPGGNAFWSVESRSCGTHAAVQTTMEHLRWDDLIRNEWPKGPLQVLWGSVLAYGHALASGRSLGRVWRVAPMTLFSLAWPALCWLGALLLASMLGLGVMFFLLYASAGAVSSGWAGLAGAAAGFCLLALALRLEKKWNTTWLLRIYRFADRWARGQLPGLDARLKEMTKRLDAAMADPDTDEVLVVGYSVGSMLAVSLISRWLERSPQVAIGRLSLLTLGHCIPLLALMPKASAFRKELGAVADEVALHWVDVSSPTDWGSFALADPVPLSLKRKAKNPRLMASPRFHTLFEAQRYMALRKDKRRIHLQYLMSGEQPGGYDYFDITAGSKHLWERRWDA